MITRRSFVKTAISCAAAATALPLHALAPLHIGISTVSYQSLSFDDMVAQLKTLLPMNGLNNQEAVMSHKEFFATAHPADDSLQAVKQTLTSNGIHIVSYYAGVLTRSQEIDESIRIAKAFGARTISANITSIDLLKQVDQAMAQTSLQFGIRNVFSKNSASPFATADGMLNMLEGLSPNIGVTVDTGNFAASGQDPVGAVHKLGTKIKVVHLKDVAAAGDETNVLLGKGIAKIKEVEAELHNQNFRRMTAVEYVKNDNSSSIVEDMQKNVGYAWEFGFSGA